MRNKLFMLRE